MKKIDWRERVVVVVVALWAAAFLFSLALLISGPLMGRS